MYEIPQRGESDPQERSPQTQLERVLSQAYDCMCDFRLPLPDIHGHLADLQIRREQIDALATHLEASWPNVAAIEVGIGNGYVYPAGKPYFDIRLNPYSTAEMRRLKEPITNCIHQILHLKREQIGRIYFLPPREPDHIQLTSVIYSKTQQ